MVGTRRATQLIKTGDKIRVDGSIGVVEVSAEKLQHAAALNTAPQPVSLNKTPAIRRELEQKGSPAS